MHFALNHDDMSKLSPEQALLMDRLYRTVTWEKIWWAVGEILSLLSIVSASLLLILLDLNIDYRVLLTAFAADFIRLVIADQNRKKAAKHYKQAGVDARNTVIRYSLVRRIVMGAFFNTPVMICCIINYIRVKSHSKEYDDILKSLYGTTIPEKSDEFSFREAIFGKKSDKRYDGIVNLSDKQKELLDDLYAEINKEHICWSISKLVFYCIAIIIVAFVLLVFFYVGFKVYSFLVPLGITLAVAIYCGLINSKSTNKVRWYLSTHYPDHRKTITRCSKLRVIFVCILAVNPVALIFSSKVYAFAKRNKKELDEIEKLIANSYDPNAILEVRHLCKAFPLKKTFTGRVTQELIAVDDVSFTLAPGETLGIVGESGCGKTTMGRAILKLHQPTGGGITFNGEDITDYKSSKMREIRKKMQIIFQDPYSSLPPRSTVGGILSEPVQVHNIVPKGEVKDYVLELMDKCGLRDYYYERYPHEFSGGQRQRICIARALSVNPRLVICDEPVSALDVSIQAQIINLLKKLQSEMGLTYVFISHDLSVVKFISDKIGVMYLGSMVEYGTKKDIFARPLHPYTQALFSAIPHPDPSVKMNRIILKGDIPSPANPPKGCRFHTRCPHATERCMVETPEYKEHEPGHFAACHLLD